MRRSDVFQTFCEEDMEEELEKTKVVKAFWDLRQEVRRIARRISKVRSPVKSFFNRDIMERMTPEIDRICSFGKKKNSEKGVFRSVTLIENAYVSNSYEYLTRSLGRRNINLRYVLIPILPALCYINWTNPNPPPPPPPPSPPPI